MTRNEKFKRWFDGLGWSYRQIEETHGIAKTTCNRIVTNKTRWRDEDSEIVDLVVKAMGTTRAWFEDDTQGFPIPVAGVAGAFFLGPHQLKVLQKAEELAYFAGETDQSLRVAQMRLFGMAEPGERVAGKSLESTQESRAREGRSRPNSAG